MVKMWNKVAMSGSMFLKELVGIFKMPGVKVPPFRYFTSEKQLVETILALRGKGGRKIGFTTPSGSLLL